jgi:hypothetical protein
MNRAPSDKDFWWAEHRQTCGGSYTKVKEPEGYGQKKKGGKEKDKESDSKGVYILWEVENRLVWADGVYLTLSMSLMLCLCVSVNLKKNHI